GEKQRVIRGHTCNFTSQLAGSGRIANFGSSPLTIATSSQLWYRGQTQQSLLILSCRSSRWATSKPSFAKNCGARVNKQMQLTWCLCACDINDCTSSSPPPRFWKDRSTVMDRISARCGP